MTPTPEADPVQAYLDEFNRAPIEVLKYYELLLKMKQLRSALIYQAYCSDADSCLLVRVFQTPKGLAYFIPRYKLSPSVNERHSSPEGRAEHTEDGDRRWIAHGSLLKFADYLILQCDHFNGDNALVLRREEITGKPGNPTKVTLPERDTPEAR